MTSPSARLVVVTGSSAPDVGRAEQIAVAAAHQGWEVHLIGCSPTAKRQRSELGGVRITRLPIADDLSRAEDAKRTVGSRLLQPGADRSAWRAAYRARNRMRADRIAWLEDRGVAHGLSRLSLRGVSYLDRLAHRARLKWTQWDLARLPDPEQPIGDWRRDAPGVLDLDLALGPATERYQPDLIHACGIAALYSAALAAARLRRAGHLTRLVYDTDCLVPDHHWESARTRSAYPQLEREFIGRADAIVVDQPKVAAALARHYQLTSEPVVIKRVPDGDDAVSVGPDIGRLYATVCGFHPAPRAVPQGHGPDIGRSTSDSVAGDPGHDPGPGWRRLTNTTVRLGLGVANYAGQLGALAHAVTAADPDVSAEVITRTMSWTKGYPSDVNVPGNQFGKLDVQLDLARRVLPRYTHLISDAFLPVLGYLNGTDIAGDLPALDRAGIKTALLCHGSEIRDPQRHLDRMPHSLFRFAPPERLTELRTKTRRNAEILAQRDLPVFVTTPDLLADVPTANWVPLVVDVDLWDCDRPVFHRPRPVVLHAPSARWSKGTDLFLGDLEDLADLGVIELRLVESLSWPKMRDQVFDADIVVDQVAVGCYGTFACEAMAAGKPVVVYLHDDVLATIGEDVPVANSSPTAVRQTVEQLLDDRVGAKALGLAAREFIRRVHDGRRSASVVQEFLRS